MIQRQAIFKHLDAVLGAVACRVLTRAQQGVQLRSPSAIPGRLLVIRPGGIGDLLLLLPALERLQACDPNRPMDLVCEQRNAAIAPLSGLRFDTILCYDSHPWKTVSHLRRNRYAVVVDTEQFHHFSAVLGALTRAPIRIGFHVNPRRNGLYTHLVPYDLCGREDRQFATLARRAGATGEMRPFGGFLCSRPLPSLPPEIAESAQAPLLVAHAGGAATTRNWPVRHWIDLCGEVVHRRGMSVCLVGSKNDASLAETIRRSVRKRILNTCGCLTLAQTATLCRRASVFVGADSGISHLAVALDVPTVTLFGPSDPGKWSTDANNQTLIQSPQPCSPCALFGYLKPCACASCIRNIRVSTVLKALPIPGTDRH